MRTIMRYLVTLADGRRFFFEDQDRAARFQSRNPGSAYGGYVAVPLDAMPPVLQRMVNDDKA